MRSDVAPLSFPGPLDERELFGALLEIAADAILSVDEAQRILLFNRGAEEIFGYTREEVLGQPLDILIPEPFRSVHREVHIPAFAASPVQARRMAERQEIYGLRKDGRIFPAEASISKLAVGGRWVFMVVLRDITARKQMEEALRLLADAGRELAASLDERETVRTVARLAVRALADYCAVDVVDGERVERAVVAHRDPARAALAAALEAVPLDRTRPHLVWSVLRTGEPVRVEPVTPEYLDSLAQNDAHRALLHAIGPRSLLAVPLEARGNLLGAMVLIAADSGRRYGPADLALAEELGRRAALALDNARLYRAAREATAAREELVSVVSHDLGNPLGAVRVRTRLLERLLAADAAAAREHIEAIRAATEQMERLVSDLLDLRRIGTGRLALEPALHDPAELVAALEESFRPLAAERSLVFEVACDPAGLPAVRVDRLRILQALGNLVANAVKFTPEGGRMGLAAARDGAGVRFEVWDTGPGITPEDLPRIFDRYWQGRASGPRSIGLGLAIAKGIVEAHGGRIWAESRPGAGARFCCVLPAGNGGGEAAAAGR